MFHITNHTYICAWKRFTSNNVTSTGMTLKNNYCIKLIFISTPCQKTISSIIVDTVFQYTTQNCIRKTGTTSTPVNQQFVTSVRLTDINSRYWYYLNVPHICEVEMSSIDDDFNFNFVFISDSYFFWGGLWKMIPYCEDLASVAARRIQKEGKVFAQQISSILVFFFGFLEYFLDTHCLQACFWVTATLSLLREIQSPPSDH